MNLRFSLSLSDSLCVRGVDVVALGLRARFRVFGSGV